MELRDVGNDKFMNRKHARKIFLAVVCAQLAFSISFIYWIDLPSQFSSLNIRQFDRSQIVLDREGEILNVSLSKSDEWCVPISLDKMGSWTKEVVIALEDKRFEQHAGVDMIAVLRAFFSNIRARHVISGASTITSQLIRISIPRKRTLYTKLLEFWSALRLEN
ncbi:MAG: transglycosylase domain-containing protein, partial [Synergistaceae bacterium]|nr:transglycosylase domain-containing protein [Synergistaceae bacterium]